MIKQLYPLADKDTDGWYSDGDFHDRNGRLIWMDPEQFLKKVRRLEIDETSRESIDDLKRHIQSGRVLDPLKIYANDKEDGRHRAHACLELRIKSVPVIIFKQNI